MLCKRNLFIIFVHFKIIRERYVHIFGCRQIRFPVISSILILLSLLRPDQSQWKFHVSFHLYLISCYICIFDDIEQYLYGKERSESLGTISNSYIWVMKLINMSMKLCMYWGWMFIHVSLQFTWCGSLENNVMKLLVENGMNTIWRYNC
jgi:hypothetical protein